MKSKLPNWKKIACRECQAAAGMNCFGNFVLTAHKVRRDDADAMFGTVVKSRTTLPKRPLKTDNE